MKLCEHFLGLKCDFIKSKVVTFSDVIDCCEKDLITLEQLKSFLIYEEEV